MNLIQPRWPAPARVRAAVTTRRGGCSIGPYASLNLGDHVGDDPQTVAANRARLREALALPSEPRWLRQVHGCAVADGAAAGTPAEADAAISRRVGEVCAVLTADCLPVLFCDRAGSRVGIAHAGWRGLAAGVLGAAVRALDAPGELMAWLGPAIGPEAFEVGAEVREAFVDKNAAHADAFRASRPNHWLADLYALARRELTVLGVEDISGGGFCTFADGERFFSYRRDGRTGRMASLIWLE